MTLANKFKTCKFVSKLKNGRVWLYDAANSEICWFDLEMGTKLSVFSMCNDVNALVVLDEYMIISQSDRVVVKSLDGLCTDVYFVPVPFLIDITGHFLWKSSGEILQISFEKGILYTSLFIRFPFVHNCTSFIIHNDRITVSAYDMVFSCHLYDVHAPYIRLNCECNIHKFGLFDDNRIVFTSENSIWSCSIPSDDECSADVQKHISYNDFLSNGFVQTETVISDDGNCCSIMHNVIDNYDILVFHPL